MYDYRYSKTDDSKLLQESNLTARKPHHIIHLI